ncbi:MAG: hypothetical protein ABI972_31050 [Acidobacteriota bacterium]
MRLVLLAAATFGSLLVAADLSPMAATDPPKCEKATRTLFWPDEANTNARAAVRLAREGKLLICTRDTWRYKWRAVAMNLRAAMEEKKEKR